MVELWLGGKSKNTQSGYANDIKNFLLFVEDKPLGEVTLSELYAYRQQLESSGVTAATVARKISAVKSLYRFAYEIGLIPFDLARLLKTPSVKNKLAEHILNPSEVLALIEQASRPRDRALLTLMYATGARVSEICHLTWRDCYELDSGACRVNILGKGGKTRTVLVSALVWAGVKSLRQGRDADSPVFVSRKKSGALTRVQVLRIVKDCAKKAGLSGSVSPHWLRHSHASHALENHASIALVKETLGHSSVATTSKYLHANPSDSSGFYLTGLK